MKGRRRLVSVLTVLALVPFLLAGILEARNQDAPKAPGEQAAVKAPEQETAAVPRPPKERMAVYVFLAWVWLSIVVLFWLLRLRVREADRVFQMGLRRTAGKTPEGQGH